MVISGIPGHGKSSWALNLIYNLAKTYGWRTAIFGPEMPAVPILRNRFQRMLFGRCPHPSEDEERNRANAWIENHFTFIDADPTGLGDSDDPFDLDWIIDRAVDAVLRDGIRVLLIDPWNEIEHAREKNEGISDYVARGIRALKRFARLYQVAVIVVAHPTKDVNGRDGKMRTPSLYDIESSAAWYNKCDHGLIVERDSENETHVHICKVKFDETGRRAKMNMGFDKDSGLFRHLSAELK
ncbi:MAG: AAA family ATPase, partial [Patescibacteria group bacterium]|nr:AAA family ATPase [Patescibacteria group bacterium]